jgi:hypothetical protein
MYKIDYFIIGAQKSGSTTIFQHLKQTGLFKTHEQPEMSYFMHEHEIKEGKTRAFHRYFGRTADKRPYLAKHAMAMYDAQTLRRIKEHNPNVKVIIVLRNPVSRAYSAFWYARKMGWESITEFSKALSVESKRLDDYIKNRNLCYISNSDYPKHLAVIKSIFDEKNYLIISTELLHQNPTTVVQNTLTFLNQNIQSHNITLTNEIHNEGGLPRSELFARVNAWLLKPGNPIKQIAKIFIPSKLFSPIRDSLHKINSSSRKYPSIQPEDKVFLEKKLSNALKMYSELKEYEAKHS